MSDAMGRRPDGPGWYWYEGDGEGVELADPVYCAVTLAITLKPGTPWYRPWTIPIEEMPGDFVPLHPPVAAPTWSQDVPTEAGDWWVWRSGYKAPDLWRVSEYADDISMRDYWEVRRNGVSMSIPKSSMGNIGWWYMPATVPQPPTWEVGP